MLNLLAIFLETSKQREILNCQCSFWTNINAGVHQGTILCPLFFVIDNFNSSSNLQYNLSYTLDHVPFAYNEKSVTAADNLSSKLKRISNWFFQWKTSFNADHSKKEQQVIFSNETTAKDSHSKVFSNSFPLSKRFVVYSRF